VIDPLLAPVKVIGGHVVAVCGGCALAAARATDQASESASASESESVPISVSAPSTRKSVAIALVVGAVAIALGATWAFHTGSAAGMTSTASVSYEVAGKARDLAGAQLIDRITIPQEPPPKLQPKPTEPFGGEWVYPLPGIKKWKTTAEGSFGARRPGHRPPECRRGHCGVDLHGPRGMPVVAILPGTVVVIKRSRWGAAGKMIRVRHDNGLISSYMHLDRIPRSLRLRQRVEAGQQVGVLGRTGIRVSPAHLHFSVARQRNHHRHYFDPADALARAVVISAPISRQLSRVATP